MIRNVFFVFGWSICLASYIPGYGHSPGGSPLWGYFTPALIHRVPSHSHQSAMEAMVDLTNNLAVAILQDHSYSRGNFAFSPYGVASVLVVLYEGARGESARQIHTAVGFPSDKDVIRIGFRDIHRHLRSYFSHEGYLSGISLNKDSSSLKPEYKNILRFYGYDIDVGHSFEEDDLGVENVPTPIPMSSTAQVSVSRTTAAASTVSTTPNREEDTSVTKHSSGDATSTTVQPTTENSSRVSTEEQKTTTTITTKITSTAVPDFTTKLVPLPGTEDMEKTTISTTFTATSGSSFDPEEKENTSAVSPSSTRETTEPEDTQNNTTVSITTVVTPQDAVESVSSPEQKETENTDLPTTTELQGENITTTAAESSNGGDDVEINLTIEENSTPEDGTLDMEGNQKGESKNKEEKTNEEKQKENGTSEVFERPSGTQETSTEDNNFEESPVPELGTRIAETEKTKTDFDNGMLIPQIGDYETTPKEKSTTTKETEEGTVEGTVEGTGTTSRSVEGTTKPGRKGKSTQPHETHIHTTNNIKMSRNVDGEKDMSKRIRGMFNSRSPLWLDGYMKKHNPRIKRTLTDYLKSPHSADLSLQLQNGMYDTFVSRNADLYRSLPRLLFLVDGAVDTPVPMMTYTNVFPYAYIPRLHAKALEFPLDDVRYKLLIILPVERRGLRQLIYDLVDFPLNNVLTAVRPTRVKAMVPTFMVEGFVILTPSLQKLGIWDVFDPRKANLSGMSLDPELYVRNVEQSVTVVIRNYVEILDIQTRTMAAREMEHEFEATHPFLYFVMDTVTNVALMAGKILDPLNSRIY